MQCERKHKRTKYEEKKPQGSCGGDMVDVTSADGTRVYGRMCNRCSAIINACQVCGNFYANMSRHLVDKDGKESDCYSGNTDWRRAQQVREFGKGLP